LIVFSSCYEKQIRRDFETVLGKENNETINYLVSNFETEFLKSQYPNLSTTEAYKEFLIELRDGNTQDWRDLSSEARSFFSKSELNKQMYSYLDSVWVVKNSSYDHVDEDSLIFLDVDRPYIKTRKRKSADSETDIQFTYNRIYVKIDSTNEDSIIKLLKNQKEINYRGSYYTLIDKLKKKNQFWHELNEYIVALYNDDPQIFARIILDHNFDLSDSTIRKFIVLECAY